MSVSKLAKENNCRTIFKTGMCVIQDCASQKTKGVGRMSNGLYYLDEEELKLGDENKAAAESVKKKDDKKCSKVVNFVAKGQCNAVSMNECNVWHNRLGHAPMEKIGKI